MPSSAIIACALSAFAICECGKTYGNSRALNMHKARSVSRRCIQQSKPERRLSGTPPNVSTNHLSSEVVPQAWLPVNKMKALLSAPTSSDPCLPLQKMNTVLRVNQHTLPYTNQKDKMNCADPTQKENGDPTTPLPSLSQDSGSHSCPVPGPGTGRSPPDVNGGNDFPGVGTGDNESDYPPFSQESDDVEPDYDCERDQEEKDTAINSPLKVCTGNIRVPMKRSPPEGDCDLEDQDDVDTAIEEAETILSMNDATTDEMITAFTRLMDINAIKAGMAVTDRIMKLVLHPKWSEGKIAEKIRGARLETVHRIRERMKREVEEEMKADGFTEVEICNPDDPQEYVVIWMKNSLECIKAQLTKVILEGGDANFHIRPFNAKNSRGKPCVSHPMSAKLAHQGIPGVKKCVMGSFRVAANGGPGVSWTEKGDTLNAESCVLLGQFYTDASSMTLSTNSLSFYPLQMTILNFSQKVKDQIVASGEAVVAYLSTDKRWRRRVDKALELQRGFDGDDNAEIVSLAKSGHLNVEAVPKREDTALSAALAGCVENEDSDCAIEMDSEEDEAEYDDSEDEAERIDVQDYLKRTVAEEILSQRIFAASFNIVSAPLKTQSLPGICFRSETGKLYKGHFALASYVADSPEINHVGCIVGGHCHRCFCEKKDLSGATGELDSAPQRDIAITKSILDEYMLARKNNRPAAKRAAMAKMKEYHIHPMFPVIADWPFSHVPGFDPYSVFRFDHMHSHPLGLVLHILKVLHRRANSNILTNNRTSFDKETGIFTWKRGAKIRMSRRNGIILRGNNWLLTSTERDCPQSNFKIDHTRGKKVGTLNSLFTEKGLISMLEAKHYKSITEVLPFLGAISDRLSNNIPGKSLEQSGKKWNDVKPTLTDLCVAYVEMDADQTRRGRVDKSYTVTDLNELVRKKKHFAKLCVSKEIAQFQKSEFNVEKFHKSCFHATTDLLLLGFYAYYDSSVFESSHIVFKRMFQGTSKRHCTGMNEATQRLAFQLHFNASNNPVTQLCPRNALVHSMIYGKSYSGKHTSSTERKAKSTDTAVLVQWGKSFTLRDLTDMMANVKVGTKNWHTFLSNTGSALLYNGRGDKSASRYATTNEFVRSCGGPNFLAKPVADILHKLSKLPYDHSGEMPSTPAKHETNSKHSELYDVRGHTTASVKFKLVNSAFVPSINVPTLNDVHNVSRGNWVIALKDDGDRHLTRLISSNSWSHSNIRRQDNVFLEGSLDPKTGMRTMWPAKALALLQADAPAGFLANKRNQAWVVVRYYDVVPPWTLHKVDRSLGCVKLQWAVTKEGDPWVDVVRADSIRGVYHCVPDGFHVLSEPENEANQENSESWKDRRVYVNRFKTMPEADSYYLPNPDTPVDQVSILS